MKNAPPENCLIGKVIAHNHLVHKQSVISILQKAWKKYSPVTIIPWKNNFFKIAFEDKSDILKVLQESPWCVMGFYLALLPWDSNKTLQEMEFDKGEFWIQAHDLPLGLLTSQYAMTIAESLGTLVDLDCIGEGPQTDRDFLRFRVAINLLKPLIPGFFLPRPDGSQSWISLRYERLSDFCYRCGCLGHCRDSCTNDVIAKYAGKWTSELRTTSVRRLQASNQHPSMPKKCLHPADNVVHPQYTTSNVAQDYFGTPDTNNSGCFSVQTSGEVAVRAPVCSNYYVTEPHEPVSLNKGISPHHFSVPSCVSIDVALADALSRLAMKRKHEEEPYIPSSLKRLKPLLLEPVDRALEKTNCNNETFFDDETSYGILKDTNQCLSTRLSRPPPIIIPSHKRRGRVKGKATFYEGTDTSHSSMSPNPINVPTEIVEFNSTEVSSRVVVADPNQPHHKC
ncbi:reverse transcriptase [Tanacetum coccineum]